MKIVLCSIIYLVFLVPALLAAIDRRMDLVDPGTSQVLPSFWLTGCGRGLLFALPFVIAGLALYVFLSVLRRLWRFVPA